MQNKNLNFLLRFAAISGNVLFVLWVTYNGINEGFRGTVPEKISYVALMCLLLFKLLSYTCQIETKTNY